MPLMDRPDFQRWLDKVETAHSELPDGRPAPTRPRTHCDLCGGKLASDFDSSTDLCLVCLAERFTRDQTEEAAYIGRVLTVALISRGHIPLDILRSVIEDTLDEYAAIVERD
jgi:hypothetical protein